MKKLLSILMISTLSASIPAPLLANTLLTRVKRDVGVSNSNNDYLPLIKLNGIIGNIYRIAVDSSNNLYFGADNGAYVLKQGEITPTKINGSVGYLTSIAVDSKDNIFLGANNGAFVLKHGETTAKKIDGINDIVNAIAVDKNDNIYYVISGSDGLAFVLKKGETTSTKINGIRGYVYSVAVDSSNNVYFGTSNGAYVLKQGETTAKKIDGIGYWIYSIIIDNSNNIYYGTNNGAFVLKQGQSTPTKINGVNGVTAIAIDKNNKIYFGTSNGVKFTTTVLDWLKQQSQFTLMDSTKTKTWTRPDLIAVDGELNIDISNPNIDKVVFDNVQQPQTNKHWTINVKPETAPRDHNLQVTFTLDGQQYTSEITVSMQAKIDPTPTPVQQNISELIKTTDLGNIIDNNDDTIFTAVNQKNGNVIDDFSQIKITKKDNHSAILKARDDSKSYKGSVDVTYNVVPSTVVDLKIDVTPTSSTATVIKDYLGQIDISNITNPVNTFYYANSESVITMVKPTTSSVITGVVYGCDDKWNKTSQSSNIDPTSGIKLDGSQLNTK
ncbi:MAG: hypothetical protein SPLM_10300 [Spiroplasma phoeniceum]|uniref:hypothetical protein n=1 Tax=Spiroplasma phoeniceum TaxID=47835 RepID=UPI003134100C